MSEQDTLYALADRLEATTQLPNPAQIGSKSVDAGVPVEVELPEPVDSMALAAWGPKPDYYTADQMHAYAIAAMAEQGHTHPSRGGVDEADAIVRAIAADSSWRTNDNTLWPRISAYLRRELGHPAALPAVADGLSAVERSAVEALIANADHDAGDVFDSPPDQESNEDAYWAYHQYHALTKLLAASAAPSAATGEGVGRG